MTPIGTFRIGATMAVALDLMAGSTSAVNIEAGMRRVRTGATKPEFSPQSAVIPLSVAARAASGNNPAGWNLTLSAAQTAELQPGLYGIDAKLTGPNSTTITEETTYVQFTRGAI